MGPDEVPPELSIDVSRPSATSRLKRKSYFVKEGNLGSAMAEEQSVPRQTTKKARRLSSGSECRNIGHERQIFTDSSRLIWSEIFTYLPPASLGCLLRVSRFFREVLESPTSGKSDLFGIDDLPTEYFATELTWQRCHRRFAPGLPQPLLHQSELQMWRLIKGSRCHECGFQKPLQTLSKATNEWTSGPEQEQLRVIWTFRVRICGLCLGKLTATEKDLVLDTSFPSFLIDGLPFTFLLHPNNVISESTFRQCSVPFGTKTSKIFYKPQIKYLKDKYLKLKRAGPSRLEAWLGTLSSEREKIEKDASRWEAWEVRGTLAKINLKGRNSKKSQPLPSPVGCRTSGAEEKPSQPITPHFPQRSSVASYENISASIPAVLDIDEALGSFVAPKPRSAKPLEPGTAAILSGRRDEIIRRCSTLSPPIGIWVLEGLLSFKAALTISKEMDDQQWGILKDRLETEVARNFDNSMSSHENINSSAVENHERPGVVISQETVHKDGELIVQQSHAAASPVTQATSIPGATLQATLTAIATTVVNDRWNAGKSLSKDSCFQFAADVLLLTQKAFQDRAISRALDRSSLPARLSLENMKWLFDTQVKPLTEKHMKEIFFCHICGKVSKPYGFEAVIQHFAAKHTNNLSLGAVIVNWKAFWPDEPPFHPNPMLLKALSLGGLAPKIDIHIEKSQVEDGFLRFSNGSVTHGEPFETVSSLSQFAKDKVQTESETMHLYQQENDDYFCSAIRPRVGEHELPPLTTVGSMYQDGFAHSGRSIPNLSQINTQDNSRVIHARDLAGLDLHSAETTGPNLAGPTTDTFRFHQAEMAKLARKYWFATAGVKGFSGTVRMQVIIHHACERFVTRFRLEPGVNMFLFGLNHEASMRPLRGLNGFSCKACALEEPGALHPSDRKDSATLPHLLNHFMTSHAEYFGLDWRKDMIQLPSSATIAGLTHAPGMDETKLYLLTSAFPSVFANPPLFTGPHFMQEATSLDLTSDFVPPSKSLRDSIARFDNASKDFSGYSGIIIPSDTCNAFPSCGDNNEYDPRRPSYIGRIVDTYHGVGSRLQYHRGSPSSRSIRDTSPHGTSRLSEVEATDNLSQPAHPQPRSENMMVSNHGYHVMQYDERENSQLRSTSRNAVDIRHDQTRQFTADNNVHETDRTFEKTSNGFSRHAKFASYREIPGIFASNGDRESIIIVEREYSLPYSQSYGDPKASHDRSGGQVSYASGAKDDALSRDSHYSPHGPFGVKTEMVDSSCIYVTKNGEHRVVRYDNQYDDSAKLASYGTTQYSQGKAPGYSDRKNV